MNKLIASVLILLGAVTEGTTTSQTAQQAEILEVHYQDAYYHAEARQEEQKEVQAEQDPDEVRELTEEDFWAEVWNKEENTIRGDHPWFIKFYAPWCGHCRKLAPTWKKFAKMVEGNTKVAKVDCTVQSDLCKQFGVKGYPHLKYYDTKGPKQYTGQRDIKSLGLYLWQQQDDDEGDFVSDEL